MSIAKEIQQSTQKKGNNWDILKEESPDIINQRLAERLEKEAKYVKKGLDKLNFYKI
jgi:hypothetical protein